MRRTPALALALALLLPVPTALAQSVEIDWKVIDGPGNADDDQLRIPVVGSGRGIGAVPYVYRIGTFEVTNEEYAAFLNAVAASDPAGLYEPDMAAQHITRSGADGSFSYAAVATREDRPVGFVDFYDALRFANWLHNGQPEGAQDATTTEDGAYTLEGQNPPQVARNEDAVVFLPSQDEWYKAAYYDRALDRYWIYPTGSDEEPVPEGPPGGPNSANFCPAGSGLPNCPLDAQGPGQATDVGAYLDSASPYGTYDQGGNHLEWNEELSFNPETQRFERGIRGGWYNLGPGLLQSSSPLLADPEVPIAVSAGFRVATLPEPGAVSALLALPVALLLARRRSR